MDIPDLEGYSTVPDVAAQFKLSRQRMHQLVTGGAFPNARKVGPRMIVVPDDDVAEFAAGRKARTVVAES